MSRYDNSCIYVTWEYTDETSQFDPKGRWVPGLERYERTFRVRVPRKLLASCQAARDMRRLNDWLERNGDKPGVYID